MTSPSFNVLRPRAALRRGSQRGTTLIEVLVTLIILMIGLLGLVGLMVQSQRGQIESYQRVQALVVMQDMVNRINTNKKAAACYAITTSASAGTPFVGTTGTGILIPLPVIACATGTAEQRATAIRDMNEWNHLLLGSAETSGGAGVGAMIGARGCVSLVEGTIYRVTVTWQGQGATKAPPFNSAGTLVAQQTNVPCGKDLYNPAGDTSDNLRRAVYQDVQIVDLLAITP